MPDMSGLELVKLIKAWPSSSSVVIMTLFDSVATTIMQMGADHYIPKPEVRARLSRFLAQKFGISGQTA